VSLVRCVKTLRATLPINGFTTVERRRKALLRLPNLGVNDFSTVLARML